MSRADTKAEELFKTIFLNSPIGVYVIQDGKFCFINPKFRELTGYTEDELLGKPFFTLILPEDRTKVRKNAVMMLKGETFSPFEHRARKKDGVIQWVMETIISILYNGKRATLGNVMDITEQKLLIEKLRESEEQLRTVIEAVKEGVTFSDEKGRFVVYNRAMEGLTGYSMEEANTSADFIKLIHPDQKHRDKAYNGLREISEKEITREVETIFHTKDGQLKHVLVSTSLISFKGQKMFLSTYRDITERKCAEEELRESFNKLRKAMGAIIQVMAATIETRDPYTAGHQQRVAKLARAIAKEMMIPEHDIDAIRMAGIIHDIGKICVPAEILSKPGKITELESSMLKTHVQTGFQILESIEFPWPIADIVLQHHERMNGSGYPKGIKGDEILLEARIIAVADVVEAMASHRPYRPALGIDAALNEIEKNKGVLYDEDVVDTCVRLFREKGFSF